jgi:hypothetical protein
MQAPGDGTGPPTGSLVVRHITVDCHDPYELSRWWSEATGWPQHEEDRPGDEEAAVVPPDPRLPWLLFIRVPEGKVVKNRVHLDLAPTAGTRDQQVDRLVGLGARLVADHRRPDGTGWAVLADPEGNEFCVERGAAERAQSQGG